MLDLLATLDTLKNESETISHEMINTFESDNAMHEMTQIYQKLKDKTQVLLLAQLDLWRIEGEIPCNEKEFGEERCK